MKLLPLIGALLISAVPVQAFETYEELVEACNASEENTTLCRGADDFKGAIMAANLLCDLEDKGRLTKENLVLSWDEWTPIVDGNNGSGSPVLNWAVETILINYPDCSIKPIP